MARLIHSFDWRKSSIGPMDRWPESLRTVVNIALGSRFPILVCWGPDLAMIYNDGYRQIIADKHPFALGRPGKQIWAEIWHIIGPQMEGVMATGAATWTDNDMFLVDRHGYAEECYFRFSFSPILDEHGNVAGVFMPVTETTDKVIGERRLKTLHDFGVQAPRAEDALGACALVASTLENNPYDVPFALVYLFDSDGATARLAGSAGTDPGADFAPELVRIRDDGSDCAWSLSDVLQNAAPVLVEGLRQRHAALPTGAWQEPPDAALALPILLPGHTTPIAALVCALNPHQRLDAQYREFLELLAAQVATMVANAIAHAEERRRADALTALDRAKSQFFSNVSHEFRTPLTLMLGPVEDLLVERVDSLAPDVAVQLKLAHRNGMRLLKLVNSLLDFSRIEAGRAAPFYEAVDLAAFTAEIASMFRSTVEKAGIRLTVDCAPLGGLVCVDRDMWEKVVLNLISNAFKFTFAGEIAVRLRACESAITLEVRDTGVGIPADELPRLGERFHRVRERRGRTLEGTGIGLALVKEMVKLHGGEVQIASELGAGTAVTVALPYRAAPQATDDRRAAPRPHKQLAANSAFIEEALHWLPSENAQEKIETAATGVDTFATPRLGESEASGRQARILVADDNADMRSFIAQLLAGRYGVETVGDGEAALRRAAESPPDLVLADVMMPGLDGFELLRALRGQPITRAVPVVLISARAGEEARIDGLRAGADDYLVKPFSARELLARIDARLEMRQVRQGMAQREHVLLEEARSAKRRLESVLSSISDAFIAVDRHWRCIYVNDRALRLARAERQLAPATELWELMPEILGTPLESVLRRAMETGAPARLEHSCDLHQRWFDVHVYPAEGGLSLYAAEITDRKRAELALQRANDELERRVQARTAELAEANAALEAELVERERVARELTRLHEEYRSLVSSARAVLWRGDPHTRQPTFVSHEAEALLGYRVERWLREPDFWEAHLYPDDRVTAKSHSLEACRAGRSHESEYRMVAADGRVVWVRDLVNIVDGSSGKPELIGVLMDITPQKSAALALRDSEARLRAVVDNSDAAIFLKDVEGRYLLVNRQFCEITGIEEAAVIGKTDRELFDPEQASLYRANDFAVQRAGASLQFDESTPHRDKFHISMVNKFPVFDAGGRICAVGGIATDITDRKRAEERIRDLAYKQSAIARLSERALASDDIDDLMHHAVGLLAETLKVKFVNVLELLADKQELVLRQGIGWRSSAVGQRVPAALESQAGFTLADGQPAQGRWLRTTKTVVVEDAQSEQRFRVPELLRDHGIVSGMSTVIYGADQPFGVLGVHTGTRRRFSDDDIWFLQSVANVLAAAVQRAASGHQVRRSERQLAEAQRLTHMGNWEWRLSNGTLTCSEELYRIFGLDGERFGATYEALLEHVHPEDRAELRECVEQALVQRAPFAAQLRIVRPDGDIRILQMQGRPRLNAAGNVFGVVGVCLDITELKSAEAAVLETERRFHMLAESAPMMIWLTGRDKACTYVNRHWLEFTGRTREQELGSGWSQGMHPDDQSRCLQIYETAFETRAPFTMEFRLRRRDGTYRWILDHGAPRYDADGNFVGYVGSCLDIHERVQLERIQAIHHSAMRAIANARNVDATYRGALGAVCQHLQWPVGEVWEVAPDGETLRLAAAWHEGAPQFAAFVEAGLAARFRKTQDFPGRVWNEGRLLLEPNIAEDPNFRRQHIALGVGLRSALGIPIVGDGHAVGMMLFMSSALTSIDPPLEETLSALATQVGAVAVQRAAEQRLRESDERFRLLVEGLRDYAVFMLDPDGHVISWNSGAEQINGYRSEEILGQHFSCFYTPRDIAARKPERDLAIARTQGRVQDEGWRARKDGGWFWASVVITATRDASGALRGFSNVTRDMTERKRAEEDLRSYADRLRALSNRLVEVQESERRRIAAELHDRVGQTFTALNINLNILKAHLPIDEALANQSRINDCLALVEWTVEGIREVMADLRPAVLDDYGLPAALRWYAEQFQRRTGITTRVIAEASISRLSPASEAALFRITQEALTNIAKHAGANSVDIHVLSNPKAVSLTVVDDGAGFEPKPGGMGEYSGWGVMIMRERAEAMGGWFSLESAPGQGTRIEATIPR